MTGYEFYLNRSDFERVNRAVLNFSGMKGRSSSSLFVTATHRAESRLGERPEPGRRVGLRMWGWPSAQATWPDGAASAPHPRGPCSGSLAPWRAPRGADALDARGIGECAELALGAPPKCVRRSGDRYAESRVGLSVTWKLGVPLGCALNVPATPTHGHSTKRSTEPDWRLEINSPPQKVRKS